MTIDHKKKFHSFYTKNETIHIDSSFSSFEEAHQLRTDNRSVGYKKCKNSPFFIHIFTTKNRKKDKTFPKNTRYYYRVHQGSNMKYTKVFREPEDSFTSIKELLKDYHQFEKNYKDNLKPKIHAAVLLKEVAEMREKTRTRIVIPDDSVPISYSDYSEYCSAIKVPRDSKIDSIPNLKDKIQWEFEEANNIFNDFIKEKEKDLLKKGRFWIPYFFGSIVLFFSSIAGSWLTKNPLLLLLTLFSVAFFIFIGDTMEKIESRLGILEVRKKSPAMSVPKDVYKYSSTHIYLKTRLLERFNDESIVSKKEELRYKKLLEDLKANHEKIIYGKCRIEEQNLEDFFEFAENSDAESLEKFAKQKQG